MATNYDPNSAAVRDRARRELGDTGTLRDESDDQVWFHTDELIAAQVEAFGYNEGIAQLADGLRVRFSQEPEISQEETTGARVELKARIAALLEVAKRLRTTSSAAPAAVIGSAYVVGQLTQPKVKDNFL
jgi:hypothetical protein